MIGGVDASRAILQPSTLPNFGSFQCSSVGMKSGRSGVPTPRFWNAGAFRLRPNGDRWDKMEIVTKGFDSYA